MNLHDIYLAAQLAKNDNSGGNVDLTNYYTKSQTDSLISEKVAEIVANAPDDFDTLKEMSDWIANHEDSAVAMNTAIATNTAAIANKVDKVTGKGLSTNDFTNADKSKLDSLENYDDTEIKTEIAETAEQSALNRSTLGYQRKNLLENLAVGKTLNGLAFTVNADKSVTLNGTLQAGKTSSFYLNENLVLPRTTLKKTKGFLIGAFNKSTGAWAATLVNTNTETFDASNFDYDNYIYKANIQRSNGAVYDDVVVYPMIYFPEITDDTYEPYKPNVQEQIDSLTNQVNTGKTELANTSEQAAINKSTLGYQVKNLLLNNCKTTTKNGVTATVNADKSITLTGSNTSGSAFVLYVNMQTGNAGTPSSQYTDNKKWIPNGNYILSGSTVGASIQIRLAEIENSEGEVTVSSNGGETTFTVTDAHKYVWSRVLITPSADFGSEGITIYPMIRLAEITDDTYEPYRPSIEERLTALENAILGGNSND